MGAFLDDKLSILGLSEKEAQDFAEFWIPELLRHRKDAVRASGPNESRSFFSDSFAEPRNCTGG